MSQDDPFATDPSLAVDFEITLAALLATAVLSTSKGGHSPIPPVVAFGLLLVTLVRRMALICHPADDARIMHLTHLFIEVFSTLSVLYLLVQAVPWVETQTQFAIAPVLVFIILGGILIIAAIGVQELVFRDFFYWWSYKFQTLSSGDDLWRLAARYAASISLAPPEDMNDRRRGRRLSGVTVTQRSDRRKIPWVSWLWTIVVTSRSFVLPFIVGYIVSRSLLVAFGLFVITSLIDDHLKFFYLAYGNTNVDISSKNSILDRPLHHLRRPWFTAPVYVVFTWIALA